MRLFNPYSYYPIHLCIVLAFTLIYFIYLSRIRTANRLFSRKHTSYYIVAYSLVFMVVVGLRPIHGAFGDTTTIAETFRLFSTSPFSIVGTQDSLFYMLQWGCAQVMDVEWFLFICEILYIIPIIVACYRLLRNNGDIGLLFCLAALSFFPYATNGVRNGVATSLAFLAISLIRGGTVNKIICVLLSLVASYIHKSVSLPLLCMFACYFFKPQRILFIIWLLSIVVSLLMGDVVADFFANLGFDDRLNRYIMTEANEDLFSSTGFRWDFLLYSAVPIVIGYYILVKKRTYNLTYLLLLGTYILTNSFWVMVIRAQYSNRFAYLSWFLYPIVICYPLLKLKIWPKTQGSKVAYTMVGHLAFTFIMYLIFS